MDHTGECESFTGTGLIASFCSLKMSRAPTSWTIVDNASRCWAATSYTCSAATASTSTTASCNTPCNTYTGPWWATSNAATGRTSTPASSTEGPVPRVSVIISLIVTLAIETAAVAAATLMVSIGTVIVRPLPNLRSPAWQGKGWRMEKKNGKNEMNVIFIPDRHTSQVTCVEEWFKLNIDCKCMLERCCLRLSFIVAFNTNTDTRSGQLWLFLFIHLGFCCCNLLFLHIWNQTESILKTKGKKIMHDKSHACHGQSHSKLHRVQKKNIQEIQMNLQWQFTIF